MSRKGLPTSPAGRFLRLGALAGRVGVSMAGEKILDLGRSRDARSAARKESLLRQALRIVSTLGEMKGAAMKIGQMLSLQEGLLPAEVVEVLRLLQQSAPSVPFEVMCYEVEGGLKRPLREVFATLEEKPLASASIGQVHRGVLRDGRRVAVKIQYPLIDQVVAADLDNLRGLLGRLFNLFSDADFAPLWGELRDRLLEELDYEHEAAMIQEMAELHADLDEIVIPVVVPEASARNVLTMQLVEGLSPDRACDGSTPQELKDRWGRVLFDFALRGILEHRLLHADPNLANFAFREDGSVVVYDFGCVKRIPEGLAVGYAEIFLAATEGEPERIPEILRQLGAHRSDGSLIPADTIGPYYDLLIPILRRDPPYTFDQDAAVYRRIFELGLENLEMSRELQFPKDVIFVDRCLAGHFGNLRRLRATAPWADIVVERSRRCLAAAAR